MALKHEKAIKRFGPRYGRTLKKKLGKIEASQKATYECPYCAYKKVKHDSVGIWQCNKCGARFTSKAYSVEKAPALKTIQE